MRLSVQPPPFFLLEAKLAANLLHGEHRHANPRISLRFPSQPQLGGPERKTSPDPHLGKDVLRRQRPAQQKIRYAGWSVQLVSELLYQAEVSKEAIAHPPHQVLLH